MCSHSNNKGLFLKLTPPPLKEKKTHIKFYTNKKCQAGLVGYHDPSSCNSKTEGGLQTRSNSFTANWSQSNNLAPPIPIAPRTCAQLLGSQSSTRVATKRWLPNTKTHRILFHKDIDIIWQSYLTERYPEDLKVEKTKKNVSSVASTRRTFSSPGQCLSQKGHGLGKWILEFVHDWSSP